MDLNIKRKYYNEQILRLISDYMQNDGQELRFNQLMNILNGCKDYFNEEPDETLARFRKILYKRKDL